jgi:hypothetical protein
MIRFWGAYQQNPYCQRQLGLFYLNPSPQQAGFGLKQKIPGTSCFRDFVEVGGGFEPP